MPVQFGNPPLVELIAELKWLPPGAKVAKEDPDNVSVPASLFAPGAADDLFMRFASLIGAEGFTHSERLVPGGIPAIPFQPIYRYSKGGMKPGHTVFQLGAGLFSAHITPPYKRWSDFRPFLEQGVKALLEARPDTQRDAPFSSATVRYLDCFTTEYTGDAPIRRFLETGLGISVAVPKFMEELVADSAKEITPVLKLMLPLANGTSVNVSFANGKIGAVSGVIMDSSAQSTKSVKPALKDVMEFLDEAHVVISDCFVKLTGNLHGIMKIQQ